MSPQQHAGITLNNVSKQYLSPWRFSFSTKKRQPVQALKDISFTIPAGQICGLLGTNGAGKTTLIKILATLLLPDEGEIRINGIDPVENPLEVKAMVGLVTTNDRSFYWRLSAQENLRFFATLHGLTGSKRKQRIEQLFALVQLEDKRRATFMTLSTGQRQRLALARALLANPSILLLDEPTTGLDPVAAERFKNFVQQTLVQEHKKTILWCTHNLPEAEQLCEQLILLHEGGIVPHTQPPDDATVHRATITCHILLHADDTRLVNKLRLPELQIQMRGNKAELSFQTNETDIPQVLQEIVNQGAQVYSCTNQKESLAKLFARLRPQEGRA